MNVEILQDPETAIAHVFLEAEEEMLAQAGSVIALKGNLKSNTTARRGPESPDSSKQEIAKSRPLFLHSFKADDQGGELYLAPALIGAIGVYTMSKYKLITRLSSYLASSGSVEIFFGFHGFKFKSKDKHPKSNPAQLKNTWLNLVGDGTVLLASVGSIYPIILEGDKDHLVNLENIVAFENSLKVSILPPSKIWWHFWLPKEETLCCFHGQGTVICQTHRPRPFMQTIISALYPKSFKNFRLN